MDVRLGSTTDKCKGPDTSRCQASRSRACAVRWRTDCPAKSAEAWPMSRASTHTDTNSRAAAGNVAWVIAAFLVVNMVLVVLLLESLDRFAMPGAPVVIASLLVSMVLAVYLGRSLRVGSEELLTAPSSGRSTKT